MQENQNSENIPALMIWGHGLSDYQEMFTLTEDELKSGIIDFGGGASSFNADAHAKGLQIITVDELYHLPFPQLQAQIESQFNEMLEIIDAQQQHFLWDKITSLAALALIRRQGIERFFQDFPFGKVENRYVATELNAVQFENFNFKLAVCGHYLFNYRKKQTLDTMLTIIKEMARVAEEVRIFPLIDSRTGELSPQVGPVLLALQMQSYAVEIVQVPYQFQRKGNAMLKVRALICERND